MYKKLGLLIAVVALGVSGLAVAARAQQADPTALATVDMELVVKAAQIDPRRPDTELTPGARESVLQVEQALDAEGLLDPTWVDGHFGTKTIEAYSGWQESLGYSGLDASGLPGRTSLGKLGEGRFDVTRELTPGSRTTYHGEPVNTRTRDMLVEVERILGHDLVITQGSYSPGNPGSAGTHDGGGVVDLSVSGWSGSYRTTVVRTLRNVGFAAWLRTPAQGFAYHIHAVALADTDQSPGAFHQSGDYYLGFNGLANRGPDDGPQVEKVTWEEYLRSN